MATRDYQDNDLLNQDFPDLSETYLPPFPDQEEIFKVLPGMKRGLGPVGKTTFLQWVDFTLEYPDQVWESMGEFDARAHRYVTFLGREGTVPAFIVEINLVDDFTETIDYSLITSQEELRRVCSGELVYSLAEEWKRESLVRSLNELALRKYDQDALEEAEELLDRAIRLSGSTGAYLHNNRGLIHWKMGRIDLAKQDFDESIKLDEENGDPYFNLGLIYFDENDHDNALYYLEGAVEMSPADSQFLTELGHLYLELGREKDAMELFSKAIENNPDDPQVDFHLGYYFLYKKNKPRKAVKCYCTGLTKDPEDQFALADLAVAHWLLGNRRKALGIRHILERNARLMPYAVSRLVYINMEIGDYENALKYYRQALSDKEPFEPEWLHYNAAVVYTKIGRHDQALNTLVLAVRAGGEPVIRRALSDKSLSALTATSAFKKLMRSPARRRNKGNSG